jgi:RNA polymerase sigma-70 factor (ECF subfamily)
MAKEREQLIREFQRDRHLLLGYLRALVGDPSLAEDLFQDVSVVVLQKIEQFDPGRDLQAWCRGIARNLVLRHRQDAVRLRAFEDDRLVELIDAAFAENAGRDLWDPRRNELRPCLEALAASSRELVHRRYETGLSMRSIAARLSRTEAAVQVALSRVRKWLADCIERRAAQENGVSP